MKQICPAILATLALVATPIMALAPAQAQEQIFQATKRSECSKAARQFSQKRYNEAMRDVKRNFAPGSAFYVEREKQYNEFWLVNRYNDNLAKCRAWFDSGRTNIFRPS